MHFPQRLQHLLLLNRDNWAGKPQALRLRGAPRWDPWDGQGGTMCMIIRLKPSCAYSKLHKWRWTKKNKKQQQDSLKDKRCTESQHKKTTVPIGAAGVRRGIIAALCDFMCSGFRKFDITWETSFERMKMYQKGSTRKQFNMFIHAYRRFSCDFNTLVYICATFHWKVMYS